MGERIWTFERRGTECSATVDDTGVVVRNPTARPERYAFTLVEAFTAPHRLALYEPPVLLGVVRAVASRLDPSDLPDDLHRKRLTWWHHFAEDRVRPWQVPSGALALTPEGVFGPEPRHSWQRRPFHLTDDAFFYGPLAVGLALEERRELRLLLLASLSEGSGLTERDGFPLFDYARVPGGDWTWDVREDGRSDAVLAGPKLTVGYQYGHDMGITDYPVERVFTGAPDLYLGVPTAVEMAIRERLAAALRPPVPSP